MGPTDQEPRIAILDDFYPQPLSAFRFEEFNFYLRTFPRIEVHSTGSALGFVNETRPLNDLIVGHLAANPDFAGRVCELKAGSRIPDADAYYAVFLNNVHSFIDQIDEQRTPFAFTLYPGGGFELDDARSDDKLARVLGSPNLRTVIATQRVTRDYLLAKAFCSPQQVTFLFGGVIPSAAFATSGRAKPRYGTDKRTFDVAFAANRYTPTGADKGYDVFIAAAHDISARCPDVVFHVVGPFDASVIDVEALGHSIRFYGFRTTDFFADFYTGIDLMVSPNRAFVLGPGGFDGFPTGTAVEAMLHGVALACTDPLDLNMHFTDGVDLLIIRPDPQDVMTVVARMMADPVGHDYISRLGQATCRRVFGAENQLEPRAAILRTLL